MYSLCAHLIETGFIDAFALKIEHNVKCALRCIVHAYIYANGEVGALQTHIRTYTIDGMEYSMDDKNFVSR